MTAAAARQRTTVLLPTLLVAALAVTRPSPLAFLELATYDLVLRAAPAPAPGPRVTIVDVDDRSLTEIGQWPWRRDLVAELIDRLRDHGAAIVALDIMFAEPDRYLGTAADPDAVLALSLRDGGVVLGYGMTFDGRSSARAGCPQHPLGLAVLGGDGDERPTPFFEATGAICSLPELTTAAGRSGFLNAAPDPDGRLRRAPVLVEFDGRVYPSLGLVAVSTVTGATDVSLRIHTVNASSLLLAPPRAPAAGKRIGDAVRSVPLDGKGNLLLRYRGPKQTFPYVSAADVLHGRVDGTALRDKIVLVGTTALGTREVVSTPLDTLFTGVEVQATIADNLLQQDFIHRPSEATLLETLVVLALGCLPAIVVRRKGHAWASALAAGGVAAAWAGSVWLLTQHGAYLSPMYPTLGAIAASATMLVVGLVLERDRATRAGEAHATSQRLMVQTLLSLTEIRDVETGRHSRRTQQYARVLARALARREPYAQYLSPERIELLATLAPLHDIGKVGVPDGILNKPGRLTPEELVEMRKHPVHGRDVIVKAEREAGVRDDVTLAIAKDIVYTHHEKWDGTGYPEGLAGEAIPIPGRVMAVVDVYDACTTRRLYMPSLSQEEAAALIVKGRGTHFDPAVVDAFLEVADQFRQLSEHPQ